VPAAGALAGARLRPMVLGRDGAAAGAKGRMAARGSTAAAGGKPWHGPDGRFRNPPGAPRRDGTARAWAAFSLRRIRDGRPGLPGLPPELVLPPAEVRRGVRDLLRDGGDGLAWLGHSSFLLRLGGRTLLTDPFLSDHASPYEWLGPHRHTPPALRPGDVPPVDVVLVSHAHYDHLDRPALAALPGREAATLVTPLGVGRYVEDLGYGRLVELDWHEGADAAGVGVTAVPAVHFSQRGPFDRNLSLWCGFRLRAGASGRTVHFTGDTAYHAPTFAETGARYPGPDMALVPIGAYAPEPLMKVNHCTPEEAVAIGRHLGARALCAMHWGAIRLTDEPITEPPGRFRAAASAAGYPPERALALRVGETHRL
jgi:N-acyl-phosphatidylethanolamine-hydrolysing phospholipase D